MDNHKADHPEHPTAGLTQRRTNHRLRMLIDQMQAGIVENRLDLLTHAHRLNELTKDIAELRRKQREPVGKG